MNSLNLMPQSRHIRVLRELGAARITRVFMDENVQKSCWGVTVWTVLVLGGMLALVMLFADAETAKTAVTVVR